MPSLKEEALRLRAKSAELWARARTAWASNRVTGRIKRPSRKALAWTGGVIGGLLVVVILFLGLFDWNYLRGPVERIASSSMGREVKIDGNLRVKILSLTPSATIEGLRIANPKWAASRGEMTKISKLSVSVKLLPLLKGQVILPVLKADNPDVILLADAQGRNNWTFGNPDKKKKKPFSLPPVQQFDINNGKLRVLNVKRRLDFTGTINSSETRDGATVQAFSLLGDGTMNGAPFKMTVSGGPLLNINPNKPYPFSADISAGATRVVAKGSIRKPFDLGVFDTSLAISGRDLADLFYLTGLALPNTPRYAISGALTRRGMVYAYKGLDGKVGDSDMHGGLSVETGGERIMLTGDLHSDRLHFDDLATILGAKPKDMTVQQAQAEGLVVSNTRLFPDTPLRVERLRSMDAKVKYRATSVVSSTLPIRRASVNVTLDEGLLTLDPMVFGFPQGQLAGKVAINARKDIPSVDLDVRVTGARIEQFVPAQYKGAIEGALLGRAKLSGSGVSVRDAAASASGQVTLVAPRGQMREALAELLGVNVLKGLGLLFNKPNQQTELRCAVADFKATNGLLTAQTLIIDTEPVIATGGGTINLKDETLALRIKGQPKEPRLLRLSIPIEIEGTLTKPKLGVDTSTAIGQGGLAVAIGALLSPLASVLAFVDAGGDKDANCSALVNRAGTGKPAPVAKTR